MTICVLIVALRIGFVYQFNGFGAHATLRTAHILHATLRTAGDPYICTWSRLLCDRSHSQMSRTLHVLFANFFFFFCTVPYGNVRSLHSDSCCFVYKGSMELSGHQSSIPASAFSTVVIRLRATLFDTGQSTPWEALIGLQLACSQLSPGLATTPVSPTAWRWVTLLLLCPPDNLQGYHLMS